MTKKTPIDLTISRNLRKIRKDRRWTLKELSEFAGVTLHQLSKYESGQDRVSLSMAVKLCDGLDVKLDVLVGLQELEPANISTMNKPQMKAYINSRINSQLSF